MDSLNNNIKIAINNGWLLNISFSNFIDIIDMLLPRKNFINIEVISSGINLIEKFIIVFLKLINYVYKFSRPSEIALLCASYLVSRNRLGWPLAPNLLY